MASSVSFSSIQPVAANGTDVTTGYPTDDVADVIWAAEHLNYGGPGGLQKAGVQVLRFLLVAIAGVTENECDRDLGADLDPSGPHLYTSTWADDEVDALDWVADHYCLTPEQTQLLGGGVLAFLAVLGTAIAPYPKELEASGEHGTAGTGIVEEKDWYPEAWVDEAKAGRSPGDLRTAQARWQQKVDRLSKG